MYSSFDIEKIKEGDPIAFRNFFEYFYPKLMGFACRFVDEYIAKDLVQEVFASYWEQKKIINADNIQSFLYKWIQNSCLNHLKHELIVDEYEARVRIADARMAYWINNTDSNDVLRQMMDKDLKDIIELSVQKLPPKCARVFRLCYFNDMTHKEIAVVMNISPRTVEGHVHQAMTFLKNDLKKMLTFIL